jgi:hypothetical protein
VDESLILLEICLSFKQYLLLLRLSDFEIKTFELCDTTAGYLWSLYMQARTQNLSPPLSQLTTDE